jgi:flavin-dependent dehydrogenase
MLTSAPTDYDAIIIGAGPAGSSTATLLSRAGWSVALLEKGRFPRRKVCGEFVSASTFPLFAELGVLDEFSRLAGPEVRRVGLFAGECTIAAAMPRVSGSFGGWGRALGREHLDPLLSDAAVKAGARLWQPYRALEFRRNSSGWLCDVSNGEERVTLSGHIIVAANGSWERGPAPLDCSAPHRPSDLLAFKAHFRGSVLPHDLMPLLVFDGGYGGLVWSDSGRMTLSCCIRRDVLQRCRDSGDTDRAGESVLRHILSSCVGARQALQQSTLHGSWISAGPIRPGIRMDFPQGIFRVGNALGEAHPIIAEGISMAAQSAWLLCRRLIEVQERLYCQSAIAQTAIDYRRDWRAHFSTRLRAAGAFATVLMNPRSAKPALILPRYFPGLLTSCAAISGKDTQFHLAIRP